MSKQPKSSRTSKQPKSTEIMCERCQMAIHIPSVAQQEVKCCNWCGGRTFLLNLTTAQAATLYQIDPETLGKRLKTYDIPEPS